MSVLQATLGTMFDEMSHALATSSVSQRESSNRSKERRGGRSMIE